MSTLSDPITLEIVKNGLSSLADEMALVILRSAYSPIVRDSMDYSTAICDRNGDAIAQGLTNPIHLGAFPDVMQILVADHLEDMNPGDAFIVNDPYGGGGMHLPDIFLIKPLFVDGAIEGFAGTLVHHADLGGIAPGSMGLQATEIFQEGLRIPIVKLFDRGVANPTALAFLEANSRMPIELMGDLSAQIAAVKACEKGYVDLIRKYGSERFRAYLIELHDYSEQLMRKAIGRMADGVYENVDYLDGLGEVPEPIRFQVKVTISGEEIDIDWTGTSPQVKGAINGPMPTTRSMAYVGIRAAIDVEIPGFSGYMRPIRVSAPIGTIVNPVLPAACAARGVICFRMLDTLLGALNKIEGSQIPALGEGGPSVVSFSGWRDGKAWLITDGILGSWGGRSTLDGVEGISNPGVNLSNQPIELIEARLPIRVLHYGFATDSGGAGRFRGGQAIVRGYELLAEEGTLNLRSDRRKHLPTGVDGGLPGSPSLSFLSVVGEPERLMPVLPMETTRVALGSRLVHVTAGGGGYGDPLKRDPEAVADDVRDGRISTAFAKDVYGVSLDGNAVAEEETGRLRAVLRDDMDELPVRQRELFDRSNGALDLCLC